MAEPRAAFAPYRGDDWPATTLPAFEAAWSAAQRALAGHGAGAVEATA